jgi:hypothetical protein
MTNVTSLLTWLPYWLSSPSYFFLYLVIVALICLYLINFSNSKRKQMQNANGPQSLNIQPNDLAMIARSIRKERDYCEQQKHVCRSLQMDQDEINYWHQQTLKCTDILTRLNADL